VTHAILHNALKQALKWGLVTRNVCDAVDPPRVAKSEITPLSAEQVGDLLAAATGDRLESLYIIAIGTGLRLGELFGLRWPDVNLKDGVLSVRHSLTEVGGKLTLTEPKTAKGRRSWRFPKRNCRKSSGGQGIRTLNRFPGT
jgi:integrase